jgi:N-acetylglucosaminyldiphosphoundecaprenol N-acetyl-beta-D-mannosaminyltransferase
MTISQEQLPSLRVLGTRVHSVDIPGVMAAMERWILTERTRCHFVVNTGMHGIMEARRDPEFRTILNTADLFAPDGILLLLTARLRGHKIKKANTGPALLWEFARISETNGYKHFMYGDTEDTLRLLEGRLRNAFPKIAIVGIYSPPFRALSPGEDEEVVANINKAQPDVLWVGLGAPKQERWIYQHRDLLRVPVAVGVGASFKFHSGMVNRAPVWLGNWGLEWLWRLAHEPGRVWRRVFIDAPQFVALVALELSGIRKFG